MTKPKKPPKKRARKGAKKRGPSKSERALDEAIARSLDGGLSAQMQRTARAVYERIETLALSGADIPVSLLGAARLCAEWHTDFMTVQAAAEPAPLVHDATGGP